VTIQDWDEVLKFVEALTKWPVVVLYLALLFRPTIARKLSGLEKIKFKEGEIIFSGLKRIAAENTPNFLKEFILKVRPAAFVEGESDASEGSVSGKSKNEDNLPEEVDEDSRTDMDADNERVELEEVQKELTQITEAQKPDEL